MKVYLEIIDNDLIQYESDGSKGRNYQHLTVLFEKHNILYERDGYYGTDIKLIRKMKISKLEGSSEFDELIGVIFNSKKIKFLKELPPMHVNGSTNGISGRSGSSESVIFNDYTDLNSIEYNELLAELINGVFRISKVPKEHFST